MEDMEIVGGRGYIRARMWWLLGFGERDKKGRRPWW